MSIDKKPSTINLSVDNEHVINLLGNVVDRLILAISHKELDMAVLGVDFDQNILESEVNVNGYTIEQFYKATMRTGPSGIVWQFNCVVEYGSRGYRVIRMDLSSDYGTESLCPGSGTKSLSLNYSKLEGYKSMVKTTESDDSLPASSSSTYDSFTPEIFDFVSREFGLNDEPEVLSSIEDIVVGYQNFSTETLDGTFESMALKLVHLKNIIDNEWEKNYAGILSTKSLCMGVAELGFEYIAKAAEFSLSRILSFGNSILILVDDTKDTKR